MLHESVNPNSKKETFHFGRLVALNLLYSYIALRLSAEICLVVIWED